MSSDHGDGVHQIRPVGLSSDVALCRERLAAAYREIAEVRALVPVKVHQVALTAPVDAPASDPLARLFAVGPKFYIRCAVGSRA